jgi:hypothetical protein
MRVMKTHDPAYKTLYAHPELVADLIRGFVHEPWVEEIDFTTLERANASYVSPDWQERTGDLVWKVRLRETTLYVCLLFEFQSQPDAWMAARMLVYAGLLYQDLLKTPAALPQGRLPAILPLVLYNGMPGWGAATALAGLQAPMPASLAPWQPAISYLLIDEQRYSEAELPPDPNLASAIIRLEQAGTHGEALRIVQLLNRWLVAPEQQGLRKDFANWMRWVLLPGRAPQLADELPEVQDLIDMEAILQQTRRWDLPLIEQGRAEGRVEGEAKGQARMLRRLLRTKFGNLPGTMDERISVATTDQLETWVDRVLTAESLGAVFAE